MNVKVALGIVAAGVIVVAAVVASYYAVPKTYPEHLSLSLNFEQNPPWRASACIQGTVSGNPDYTNVSFTWTTGSAQSVTLVVWPQGNIPGQSVYNTTASSGLGWYSSSGTEYFAAFGAPSASTVVTIQLAYYMPGHQWGGPIAGPVC